MLKNNMFIPKKVSALALLGTLLFVTAPWVNAQQNCQPNEGLLSQAVEATMESQRISADTNPRSREQLRKFYSDSAQNSTSSLTELEQGLARDESYLRSAPSEKAAALTKSQISYLRLVLSVGRCKQSGGSTQAAQNVVPPPSRVEQSAQQSSGQRWDEPSNQNLSERDLSRLQREFAQNRQAEAEKRRAGQRRRHEPEAEAHHCLSLVKGSLYGGFVNSCNFKVHYSFCTFRPKKGAWAEVTDCEEGKMGADAVGAGRTSASHTHSVEMVYWFACKDPAWSLDTEFDGTGVRGRCRSLFSK